MKFALDLPVRVLMIGAGGTGGHTAPHLYRLLHTLDRSVEVILADGDIVEEKNLVRQNFISSDLGKNKARVLAERYASAFGMEAHYIPEFIESSEKLSELLKHPCYPYSYQLREWMPILIGAVDNNRMDGNSSGIEFRIYDLERMAVEYLEETSASRKILKSMGSDSKGVLRTEVHLKKPKTIRSYTGADNVSDQIAALLENGRDVFLDTFVTVIPYGDFYKKDKAVEIVQNEVQDRTLRRRMLRLLALIPEKKSLYLAQKAMNCRNIEKIMKAFAEISVSPVTISKRQNVKHLKNIYGYMIP